MRNPHGKHGESRYRPPLESSSIVRSAAVGAVGVRRSAAVVVVVVTLVRIGSVRAGFLAELDGELLNDPMVIIRCEPERRRRARRSLCTDLSTAPIQDREHRARRCANDGRDSLLPRELSSALSWKGPWRCCSAQLSQACMPHVAVGEPGDLV